MDVLFPGPCAAAPGILERLWGLSTIVTILACLIAALHFLGLLSSLEALYLARRARSPGV